ncbi:hypothetical protein MGL_2580 [Malassezia globosa CBS 7966]|uniref:Uncharacterized protein n=1 Tax=Malassezia globosa (strain ATCC MYA-4612 / CBS 7966) TaxID=425265 RepID=A8Q4M9_MALGO|nr:uncharacterized protein MGL_2580 [Malassezia globosa CBS 7966]EDP42984.1 hypothetical protein MGL_2580 [Malassezia globosa CBS 7966]
MILSYVYLCLYSPFFPSLQKGPYPPPQPQVKSLPEAADQLSVSSVPSDDAILASQTQSIRLEDLLGGKDAKDARDSDSSSSGVPVFTEQDRTGASILNALFREAASHANPEELGSFQRNPSAQNPQSSEYVAPSDKDASGHASSEQNTAPSFTSEPSTDQRASAPSSGSATDEGSLSMGKSIDLNDLFGTSVQSHPDPTADIDPLEFQAVDDLHNSKPTASPPTAEQLPPIQSASKTHRPLQDAVPPEYVVERLPYERLTRAEFVQKLIVLLCVRCRHTTCCRNKIKGN